MASLASSDPSAQTKRPRGRRLWLALRLLGTAAGFAYVAWITDLGQVVSTMTGLPPENLALALVASSLPLLLAGARWGLMLRTYGAPRVPGFWRLTRLHLVGLFYNTCLPGGVGGDVVRGVISREVYGAGGVTPAMTVVLLERVVGLAALMLLVAGAVALRPLPGARHALPWSAAGVAAALALVAGVALVRRLADLLPGRLGRVAAHVPAMTWPAGLALALLLSVLLHLTITMAGHALLTAVAPRVTLAGTTIVVLVAMAASYFPLTVGGAGVREAAFVALSTAALGIARNDAAAVSLSLWVCQLLLAGAGGLLQLFFPVRACDPV